MTKTLIVIPAFNEQGSLEAVITDLRNHGYRNLVVIDDGSSDKTSKISQKLRVPVIRHAVNRGLGAALGTGFEFAKGIQASTLVTFDSDGQHKAKDIPRVLARIKRKRADVVIGSRLLWERGVIPVDRLILNHLSNIATYILYGVKATDTQSGLRAFNKKAIDCIKIRTQRMEVSNEFFKEIKRNKLRFAEVPIEPIYTDYSQKSSSQGNFAAIRIGAKMILRLFR